MATRILTGSLVLAGILFAATGCETGGGMSEPRVTGGTTIGWNNMESGLNPRQVLSLLDEPADVRVTQVTTTWYYSDRGANGPYVVFDTGSMTVQRWQRPK